MASGSGFGVALETGFTANENQILKTSSMDHGETALIKSSEVSSVGSSPLETMDSDENLQFYIMNDHPDLINLGEFAVDLFQDDDIQVGNWHQSNTVGFAFDIIGQVDTNLLQSLNEPQQSRNIEMPGNKKKQYNRHKKGPKQLSKNEVKDEGKWKNVERCRDYRSMKKLTTAEEIAELDKLEEMNVNLKEEEDERKERVSKMKDMYLKLIHEGTIKFIQN